MQLTHDMYARWCTMLCELALKDEHIPRKDRALLVATKEWARKGASFDKAQPIRDRAERLLGKVVTSDGAGLALRILHTGRMLEGDNPIMVKERLQSDHMAEAIFFAKKLGAKEIMLRAAWNLIFS